jgi:isoleucyl-tRNA synthetase
MKDTLDVWFDSGTTHWHVMRGSHAADLSYPADLYLEGSDQHRGWFQSSLLSGCAIDGRAPYKALLTHGFVVDGKGHKMSKSKGNVIAPQQVSDKMGADILRLWTASTDYSGELTISMKSSSALSKAIAVSATRCASCSPTCPISTRLRTCCRLANGWKSTATHWP